MRRPASRFLLVCLVIGSSSLSVAETEVSGGIVLSSGVPDGGYWNAGTRLQAVAESELGLAVEHRSSKGSLENLEELLDPASPVNLVFAQADAVQYYLNSKNPGEVHKLELIENVGEECVFIITGGNSDLRDDGDLENAKDLRLGIASADSGVAVTFDYMSSQMPGLIDATVRYGETVPLLDKLNKPDSTVDAVMTVHRPREMSPEVNYALSRPGDYRFVELDGDRLEQELWDGRKVYRSMRLAMPGAKEPVQTICVLGLLLGNKEKLTLEQRDGLNTLADYHWMKVYVTE